MARRFISDFARLNYCSLIGLVVGSAITVTVWLANGELGNIQTNSFITFFYLVAWPIFVISYLLWTHLAYSSQDRSELIATAKRETSNNRKWWTILSTQSGASSISLTGALVAVAITIVVAQSPEFRTNVIYVGLGLFSVACSWLLMVYSFALDYLRFNLVDQEGSKAIVFAIEDKPRFGDYLTLAFLLSTMAAAVSAKITSRRAWLRVRINVLFAFAFNSVIVAMMVSLLFGGLLNPQ